MLVCPQSYWVVHPSDLLEPLFTCKAMMRSKINTFLTIKGGKLVEKAHQFVALHFEYLSKHTQLLIKIIEKFYSLFISHLLSEEVPPARFCDQAGIPLGHFFWAADVGAPHSAWQSKVTWKSSDVVNYIPPTIPFSHHLKFWRGLSTPQELTLIRDLLIEGAFDDLKMSRTPQEAAFRQKFNQGLVLRSGFIFENNPHCAEPVETNPDGSSNKTFSALQRLKNLLPFATHNRGMTLVRITNIPLFPVTEVTTDVITPPHKDDDRYGEHIYSLSLWASSALIFAKERNTQCPPVCIWPDEVGTLSHFSNELRTDFFHWVPNNRTPRVSITWRPFTIADLPPQHTAYPASFASKLT